MKKIAIYIAGSIQKDKNDANRLFADDKIKADITNTLKDYEVIIFDPNKSKTLGSPLARFGKDLLQVSVSNFLIIDCREKRGLGVGAEMMYAKTKNIPVVSVCPPNSHYKKEMHYANGDENLKWIHPFIFSLSDVLVEDFKQAGEWISNYIKNPKKIKSIKITDEGINLYKKDFLDNDEDFIKQYNKIK